MLGFVVHNAASLWDAEQVDQLDVEPIWLAFAAVAYSVGWFPSVWFMRRLLSESGHAASPMSVARSYYCGHLGKYVPGKATVVLIRALLLRERGVPFGAAALATVAETLAMMGTGTARGDDRAQAAAEAAIQNPLLDDVNLAGANGILVNITAGADFTMAEFDEIGRTIDGFASEDATVVVGTVLDPDMQDEVRVTVVATGLNRAVTAKTQRPGERAPIKLVRNATTGQPEFGEFDNGGDAVSKAVGGMGMGMGLRRPSADTVAPSAPSASGPAAAELPNDYLDIPAFLRRQAD